MTLPSICSSAKTGLEKKLLMYFSYRQDYRFELRYPDSTLYNESDLPETKSEVQFVPMPEIGKRVFMFKLRSDKKLVKDSLDGIDKTKNRPKRHNRRSRR
jgi:hypothetical protein